MNEPKKEMDYMTAKECTEAEESLCAVMREIESIEGFKENPPYYIWQLQICSNIYNKLKEALKSVCGCQDRITEAFMEKYSIALVVYVAEWFKRERETNEAKKNGKAKVFSDIGINNIAQRICDTLGIMPYEANDQSRWLSTLYTFGGFPLKNETHFKELCKDIYELKLNNNDDLFVIDKILNAFDSNDQAFRQSLTDANGSLRKYVEYIWEHNELPITKDGENDGLIDAWNKAIKDGCQAAEKNYRKFQADWEAQYYGGKLKMTLLLSFNKNVDIERPNIPAEVLRWKGIEPGDKFRLIVKNGENVLRRWSFYKCKDDNDRLYYTNHEGYERYVLASDIKDGYDYGVLDKKTKGRIDFTKELRILIETPNGTKPYSELKIDEPVKFRFEQHFLWNTLRTRGKLALLLPRYEDFKNPSNEFLPQRIGNCGWLPVNSPLVGCTYNGKTIKETPYVDGEIVLEREVRLLSDVICYDDSRCPSYTHGDITENNVILLRNTSELNVYIANKEDKTRQEKDYTKEYNLLDNNGDLKTVEEGEVRHGYLEVTVKLYGKTKTAKCYIVGNNFEPKPGNVSGSDEDFEDYSLQKDEFDGNGTLYYHVYKGVGLYNDFTKRRLGKNAGIIRHLKSYYYRNAQGKLEALCSSDIIKYDAFRKVLNDVGQTNHSSSNPQIVLNIKKEVNIQTFSNKTIEVNNGKYRIRLNNNDKENNTLDGCLFYYRTFEDLLNEKRYKDTVDKIPNGEYIDLQFEQSETSDGLLFQSFTDNANDNTTSEYYFRPVFIPRKGGDKSVNKLLERRNSISKECQKMIEKGDFNDAIKSFFLATEHKLYYTSLNSLVALVYKLVYTNKDEKEYRIWEQKKGCKQRRKDNGLPDAKLLINFYFAYLDFCSATDISPDIESLYSLSDELLFDWWFIPKCVWEKYRAPHQTQIEQLLLAKPTYSDEEKTAQVYLVEHYWEDFSDNNKIRNLPLGEYSLKVAKSIRSTINKGKKDNFFYPKQQDWNKRKKYNFSFVSLKELLIIK